jgi:hypothetical protein
VNAVLCPELASLKADAAVELKGFDGSTSNRSDTDDARAIGTPTEMVSPPVATRMKKTSLRVRLGVKGRSLRLLVVITEVAGKAEVIKAICAPLTARNDVINGKFFTNVTLLRLAILATVASTGTHPTNNGGS